MFGSVQRFGTVSRKPFLNRGTVRRGGERGIILEFVKFAYEGKNMLLHIFRLEAKRSKAAGGNSMEVQEPRGTRRVRGYKWKGPLRACEDGDGRPFYAAGRYSCAGERPQGSGPG